MSDRSRLIQTLQTGFPHSIQGTGDDGCEFLLIFDDGSFSEDSTFLLTDYLARTPKEILSKNFRVPEEIFDSLSEKGMSRSFYS
jgi:hypothetical protein